MSDEYVCPYVKELRQYLAKLDCQQLKFLLARTKPETEKHYEIRLEMAKKRCPP